MAQARAKIPLLRKNRPKRSRQNRSHSQNNLRAHSRARAANHSQTFCKSLGGSFFRSVRPVRRHPAYDAGSIHRDAPAMVE